MNPVKESIRWLTYLSLNAIAQGRAEAGEARCSESPGATGYTAFGRSDE